MPDPLAILLDENVPFEVTAWLREKKPAWTVQHVDEVGLSGVQDPPLFEWAQQHKAIIVTFDEDFADQRTYPVGTHHGVVRLRVWPTTAEETQKALKLLMAQMRDEEIVGALVIVHRDHIRIRRASLSQPDIQET